MELDNVAVVDYNDYTYRELVANIYGVAEDDVTYIDRFGDRAVTGAMLDLSPPEAEYGDVIAVRWNGIDATIMVF